jgi:class 3 adenylate cyclase
VAGLKGAPALAQAVDAEFLYELLKRASTLMQEEIQRLDGLVIQGSGAYLTALFGAPMAHEDHTIRALHAALGLQQALASYADELQRTRAMTLDVGVLAARIDRLSSEVKRLLQTAAVIGTEVPVALLGAIAELSVVDFNSFL